MNARDQLAKRLCDWDDLSKWERLADRRIAYDEADAILREIVQQMLDDAYCEGWADCWADGGSRRAPSSRYYAARIISDLTATKS